MNGFRRVDLDKLNIFEVVHWLNQNNTKVLWDPRTANSIYYAKGLIFTDEEALLAFKLRFGV